MLRNVTRNRKNGFGCIARNREGSLARTQNKKTKRKPNSTTTENKRPTPIGLAGFRRHASSVRMGRRPAGSLKAYPFDLFQRTRCYVMLHEIEKDGFCRISRNWEGSLPRTQNQKTKRTQFGPLFSTKLQNESQF